MQQVKLHNNRITLLQGDCFDWLPKIKANCIDMVFADPPYYGVVGDDWDNQWATLDEYLLWSKHWVNLCTPLLKDSGSFYVCGGVGEFTSNIIHLKLLIDQLGLHFKDWITWKKSRGYGSRKGYLYAREELLWYVKNNKTFLWNTQHQYNDEPNQFKVGFSGYAVKSEFKRIPSVWTDIPEQLTRKGTDKIGKKHTTPKPLKMLDRIIRLHTNSNDSVILDPFMGSGTTGQVCATLNMRFIGIEKDPDNFNEAVSNITEAINARQ